MGMDAWNGMDGIDPHRKSRGLWGKKIWDLLWSWTAVFPSKSFRRQVRGHRSCILRGLKPVGPCIYCVKIQQHINISTRYVPKNSFGRWWMSISIIECDWFQDSIPYWSIILIPDVKSPWNAHQKSPKSHEITFSHHIGHCFSDRSLNVHTLVRLNKDRESGHGAACRWQHVANGLQQTLTYIWLLHTLTRD